MSQAQSPLDQLKIDRPSSAASGGSKGWIVVVVVLLFAAGAAGYWWLNRAQAVIVKTALAREESTGSARTLLNASGYVTARREATVSSKVTGRVMEVLIEEGMTVADGQVLARIDSSNVGANLALAEAQLESARQALGETQANLDQARRMLRRTGQLASDGVVSESDLDEVTATVAALQARLVRQKADIVVAEQQVALWKQQLDDTIIRAPFAGVVTSKNAQPGEMISPMSAGGSFTRTGICTIVDMDSLEVEVDVNETYINRVQVDQPVVSVLDSYPDWKIPSRVIAIIPTADRQKATVRVRVGFNELDPRILPDMGLKVAFQASDDQPAPGRSIVVPAGAVQRVDGRDVVWVVRDGKVERRAVTVGSKQEGSVSLAAGVSGGERVVINAPAELADGVVVKEAES